jgi:NitT/TauT family transport system permease protein
VDKTTAVVDRKDPPQDTVAGATAVPPPAPFAVATREPGRWDRGRRLARTVLPPLLALLVLAGIWQVLVVALNVPLYILPAPTKFIPTIGSNWSILWSATLTTGEEVLYGFLLGTIVGVALALVFAQIRIVRDALYPVVVFFQVIPKIALAPLMVVWFGAGTLSVTLVTFALCVFPILVNSMTGFMNIDERMLYITSSMGASRWQTFRYLRLQSALPFIFAGLRVAVVLATTGAIVGEFVGSNSGLGYVLDAATGQLNTQLIFADLTVLSLFGLLLNYLVVGVEWAAMPWRRGRGR